MAAMNQERDPKFRVGGAKPDNLPADIGLAAGVKLWKGSFVAVDNTGRSRPARSVASNSDVIVGVSEHTVDNTGGAAGAVFTNGVRRAVVEAINDTTDPVTIASIGRLVYALDDQTVTAGSGSSTRVAAGKFLGFDDVSGRPLVEVG